jgi:excisionase family DNA binding protein
MNKEILNVIEASELTRLKPATIYLYVESRRIPFLKVGSRVLFEREALIDWLSSHRVEPLAASVR